MKARARSGSWLLSMLLASGCTSAEGDVETEAADESSDATGDTPRTYAEPGPHPVGLARFVVDRGGGRSLPVELWYPAVASARSEADEGQGLAAFGVDEAQASTLQTLVDEAPPACVRSRVQGAVDAPLAEIDGPLPLVLFSHCHSCTRFSAAFVAERLASHGFVVAAPDHVGGTIFDEVAGTPGPIDAAFLEIRAADVVAVLEALSSDAVPVVAGRIDPEAIGMYGHSFGAATTGRVMQDDARVRAGVALAAPMESFVLPGVEVAAIERPLLFVVAREDNSITEIGNDFIRDNFMAATAEAWLAEVTDAGHWSFSDLCGIIEGFAAGCGDGVRQTAPAESFTYLEPDVGRAIAAELVTSFFALQLRGDADARGELEQPVEADLVEVQSRG